MTSIFHRLAIAAFSALVAAPLTSLAATDGATAMYEQLDQNRDGSIDADEASRSAQITADFREIDTDADGKIAREEWMAYFSSTGSGQGGFSATTPDSTGRPAPDGASPGR